MIITKSASEIEIMDRANALVLQILGELRERIQPGVTTQDLDAHAAERVRQEGVGAAFLGYRGYPKVLCASVNEEIVHGIPSPKKVLRSGDIIGMDFGVILEGYYGDSAMTVAVGEVSPEVQRLLDVTEDSLQCGIRACKPGNRVSDISRAIQRRAEGAGFAVVREFVGHGIGTSMHEDPPVPNYVMAGRDYRLVEGMVVAIEPMINAGRPEVVIAEDRWTASTADGSLSAHFERSIAITADGPRVLGEAWPRAARKAG
jgi:methionyl aminopeptidase